MPAHLHTNFADGDLYYLTRPEHHPGGGTDKPIAWQFRCRLCGDRYRYETQDAAQSGWALHMAWHGTDRLVSFPAYELQVDRIIAAAEPRCAACGDLFDDGEDYDDRHWGDSNAEYHAHCCPDCED